MERLDGIVADVMRVAALLPSIEELDDLEKRFVNLMVEADWPPPLDAGLPEIRELVRAFEEDPESVKGGMPPSLVPAEGSVSPVDDILAVLPHATPAECASAYSSGVM